MTQDTQDHIAALSHYLTQLERRADAERTRADAAEKEAGLLFKTLQTIGRDVHFAQRTVDSDGKWDALCEDIKRQIRDVTPNGTAGMREAQRLWDAARDTPRVSATHEPAQSGETQV